MFEVTINKVDSSAANFETLTTGMVNAVFVHFTLSDDWDGMTKVAVFSNGAVTKDILEADWDGPDHCHIPAEVLELPWRTLRVGLKGYLGDELILPATMCCLGRIKPGTNPSGDPATDPELPVWEQFLTRVTALEGKSNDISYTTIQKVTTTKNTPTTVRVAFHGVDSLEGCPELHLYVCQRRRNNEHYWRHPANWNASSATGNTKLGYGLITETHYACTEDGLLYPTVPDWMPQNGFITTEFPLNAVSLQRNYIELDLTTFLLPLLKPTDENLEWHKMGLVGVQGDADMAPLLLRFLIVKDGKPIGEARDTLCVGLSKDQPDGELSELILKKGYIPRKRIYSSIRS